MGSAEYVANPLDDLSLMDPDANVGVALESPMRLTISCAPEMVREAFSRVKPQRLRRRGVISRSS